MTASETLHAFAANLIAQAEAVEQAMRERIDDDYEQAAGESRRNGRIALQEQRHGTR